MWQGSDGSAASGKHNAKHALVITVTSRAVTLQIPTHSQLLSAQGAVALG